MFLQYNQQMSFLASLVEGGCRVKGGSVHRGNTRRVVVVALICGACCARSFIHASQSEGIRLRLYIGEQSKTPAQWKAVCARLLV